MKLYGISKTGLMLTTLVASMALVSAGNAEYEEGYYPEDQQTAPEQNKVDAETQTRLVSLDKYYSREGIYLSRDQILQILADEPEAVEFALADLDLRVLQGTNGTAHFEVSGEGKIHTEICAPKGTCINKWAGAYVHTPDEGEALLGYRYTGQGILQIPFSGNKAVWGLNADAKTYGELGSISTSGEGLTARTSAYGVRGEANSVALFSTSYGVYGKSTVKSGYGVYGENTSGGRAGYFKGPVEQDNGYGGVVKAAAYFYCGSGGPSAKMIRSFGPTGTSATAPISLKAGNCSIFMDFDISERYIQATAVTSHPTLASCYHLAGDVVKDRIRCVRHSLSAFAPVLTSGEIMLTIY